MSLELEIERLAFGGRGVGRCEGKAVFVPFTLPGERVRCRILREQRRFSEAELEAVLVPSPLRVVPRCPLFGRCGGCQWQHIPYAEQLAWKRQLHVEQLERGAGVDPSRVAETLAADPVWNYRSRAQFKCFLAPQGFVLGFYRAGSHYVIDLEQCPVCHPEINRVLPALKEALAEAPEPQRIPQLDVSVGDDGRLRCVVHYIGRRLDETVAHLAACAERLGVALLLQHGRKETLQLVHGEALLEIQPRPGLSLAYAAGGFAQVHLGQNRRLVEMVGAAVTRHTQGRVLDLFCGMGNFSLPLAERVASVVGVENYPPSIAQARDNARRLRLDNASFLVADCARSLPGLWAEGGFDAVVLDPPRSGAFDAVRELVRLRPPTIVYISCDSATSSRDIKVLVQHGYALQSSQPVDMFPHTGHIESVTLLTLPEP